MAGEKRIKCVSRCSRFALRRVVVHVCVALRGAHNENRPLRLSSHWDLSVDPL